MQLSIVNRSKLNIESRIDAEYYRPKNLTFEVIVKAMPHQPLGRLCRLISGPFGSTVTTDKYVKDPEFRYIRGQDIQGFFVDDSDPVYIGRELFNDLSKYHLKAFDILVTVVGMDFGKVALIFPDDGAAIFSCKSSLLRDSKVNPLYLVSFLSCEYGHNLIRRGQRGAAQPGINLLDLRDIPVPSVSDEFQNAVATLVWRARDALLNSKSVYSQAEQILLSELGLQNWKASHMMAYVRNYSQVARARRVDAEHFQPKYDEIISLIARFQPRKLSTFAKPVFETVRLDPQKTYRYIEISDVNTSTGEVSFTERQTKDLPPNAKIKVRGGELIVSKVRPTRGAVGIVPTECRQDSICSSAFSVYEVTLPTREFLQVVLRSLVGKTQLEKPSKGTSYPTIDDIDVREVLIPTIAPNTMESIATLIQQSHTARLEAKALLEKAKRAVEIAIEEGEEQAMAFLK